MGAAARLLTLQFWWPWGSDERVAQRRRADHLRPLDDPSGGQCRSLVTHSRSAREQYGRRDANGPDGNRWAEGQRMTSPADEIPDLERLLRNVLRLAMQSEHGPNWISERLGKTQTEAIQRAGGKARRQRPHETLRDDWEAVGLDEMRSFLRSCWPDVMSTVWADAAAADVDLGRLSAYRGKNLHAVGPPSGGMSNAEVGGMIHRLRVGLEAVRRMLYDEEGEWWPYIAAVHSNIPELRWERSSGTTRTGTPMNRAFLNEGDLVEVSIIGEHPRGPRERLRYRFISLDMRDIDDEWSMDNELRFTVPCQREVVVSAYVADEDQTDSSPRSYESISFLVHVRPGDVR